MDKITKFVLSSIVAFVLLSFASVASAHQGKPIHVHIPDIVLQNIPFNIEVHCLDSAKSDVVVTVAGVEYKADIIDQIATVEVKVDKKTVISVNQSEQVPVNPIPLWLSILPPLVAILMALVFKEVVSSLFTGILLGTTIIFTFQSNLLAGFFKGLLAIPETYILNSLLDSGHLSIIVFSMTIGGMVGVITKNGGMKGVVNKLVKYAKTPRSGQFITWLLGIAIFFDDYANTLVVGNTMRPVTDRLKISRQKLAYIVDSTAAPIAAIAFVTTWIGAELSYIESGINNLGLNLSPYNVFLNSLAYSFYPIFTLVFMLMLIYRKVDFGTMYKAEITARKGGDIANVNTESKKLTEEFESDSNITPKAYNAIIPVMIVILGTFAGLITTGTQGSDFSQDNYSFLTRLSIIIGNSDSYKALLWSSMIAAIVAILLSVFQKVLSLQQSIEALISGFKTMLTAIIILILAWSLALVTEHLHTADFISQVMVSAKLSPILVPIITFFLAALVAFSTGSSWGTMAILYPLILPASWLLTKEFGYMEGQSLNIFYNVVASVLAGSVLGDHCSPISDTTILSSLASSCPHIEHVRTQMPYALTVGAVASLVGVLPAAFGISSWILFPVGFTVLYLVVRFFGKKTD